jgi:hypothetical protein
VSTSNSAECRSAPRVFRSGCQCPGMAGWPVSVDSLQGGGPFTGRRSPFAVIAQGNSARNQLIILGAWLNRAVSQ